MRQDKERIFQLRKEGRTYREIQRDTGVSRATLSLWFKDQDWSKHLSLEHAKKNLGASKERMERMNLVRKLKLQYQYALVEKEAQEEYELYKNEPLFWAGLMLYAGEGDRKSKELVRISNTDFYIHRIFVNFAQKYLKIPENSFRFGLILYEDNNEAVCKEVWSKELPISGLIFHKTQVIQGREKIKRLQYGVGMSIISSTVAKKKILKWLSLAQFEKFE
ncbi:MAG TPA: helix-turn-helix domain-containing protein [Candidatus Paceibacterota bacterium]|nr:helix-turn-helix domain-containing protein [Candidatus Paceibacterota bacterium]